jgi:hypothetical protein
MARRFDEDSDAIRRVGDPSLDPGGLSVSVSGWLYFDPDWTMTVPVDYLLFYNFPHHILYYRDTGATKRLFCDVRLGGGSSFVDVDLPTGEWFNLTTVSTIDSAGIRIYLNGTKISTDGTMPTYVSVLGWLVVGQVNPIFGDSFHGKAAEIGLWNRSLTDEEIVNLSTNRHSPVLYQDRLLACWRLKGVSNSEPDASGNGQVSNSHTLSSAGHPPGIIDVLPSSSPSSSISSNVLGLWKFNPSLDDTARTGDFEPDSDDVAYGTFNKYNLMLGITEQKTGLEFNDTSFTAGSDFDFTNIDDEYRVAIGFWWYSPAALGFTRHVTTRNATPLVAPIIAKANSSVTSGIEEITAGEWIVSEVGYSETQNVIRFELCSGGTNPTHVYESDPYTPGLHHVYATYSCLGSSAVARIAIDGKYESQHIGPSGASALANTSSDLRLNTVVSGSTSHKTTQTGAIISNLIIRTAGEFNDDDGVRMMNFGWEYIAQEDLSWQEFSFVGVGYHQPITISTTGLIHQSGDMIVARSDGSILRGYRPIWDIEHTFLDVESLDSVRPKTIENVEIEDGKLVINNTTVRIL